MDFLRIAYSNLPVTFCDIDDLFKKNGAFTNADLHRYQDGYYLLYMILTCTSFLLSGLHELLPFVFIIFFLSWHLIPLLFLNLYLGKYHSDTTTLPEDYEVLLESFSGKFEISKREREVIQLICKGLSNQEISDALFISLQTVKDHTHRIFTKTGVKNRVQLTNLIRS